MTRRGPARVERIVIDALQVSATMTGIGTQALLLGEQLRTMGCPHALEVRCAADVRERLVAAYPPGTVFRTPVPHSRPRLRRLLLQQVLDPLRDGPATLLVGLGDQGPLWGRAQLCLVVNDVRRLSQPGTSGLAERLLYRVLTPRAARRAATVLTVSAFSRDEIRRLLGVEAQVVARHPQPAAAPVGDADGHLLAVGALRPYKGLATAIEALALLPPGARRPLVVVGPEESRGEADRLRRLAARFGVGDLLRIEGWLSAEGLAAARRGAAATVNPSLFEGYGLAVAESLAHGLPTVASDIPPHREIAADAAVLSPPGDAQALARAIEAALGRREELAVAALARARQLAVEGAGKSLAAAVLQAAAAGGGRAARA